MNNTRLFFLLAWILIRSTLGAQFLVWPGDVNNNGIVNNIDLLPIGIGYNAFGPARDSVSTEFIGQTATSWNFTQPNGANLAYADCNGDGLVNYFYDAFPIYVHYQKTHGFVVPDVFLTGVQGIDPPLFLNDTSITAPLVGGEFFSLPIELGTASLPIEDLYGIAFSILIDPNVIDIDQVQADFTELSWANPDQDRIYSAYRASSSRLDVGWVRTDRNNRDGFGKFGTLNFIIIDDVVSLQQPNTVIIIDDVKMIDRFGNETAVSGDTLVIPIADAVLTTEGAPLERVQIAPNPANGTLRIWASSMVDKAFLTDMSGKQLGVTAPNSAYCTIETKTFPSGLYTCHLVIKDRVIQQKVLIQH